MENTMLELKDVKRDAKGVRRLRVLQDTQGFDNCWNRPQSVALAAGTVLETSETQSGHRGDIFFKIAGTEDCVRPNRPAFNTRHPYDLGQYNPEFLVAIDPDSEAT